MLIWQFITRCNRYLQKVVKFGFFSLEHYVWHKLPRLMSGVVILASILFSSQSASYAQEDYLYNPPGQTTLPRSRTEVFVSMLRRQVLLGLQTRRVPAPDPTPDPVPDAAPDPTPGPVPEPASDPRLDPMVQILLPLILNQPADPLVTATVAPTPVLAPIPDGQKRSARVPILMYHYLSTPPAGADIYRQDLSVTPANFARQLDRLQEAGYTTIHMTDLLLHLNQGDPLPEKPVIITFDDGYRDNYLNAFPLLQERGMTATFFIVTDFIDEERPEYLSWDMVREMYAAGMEIESHGRNHASLKGRDADYLVWQALGSLETIEYELGVRPRFISYPAGEFDQKTLEIFQSAHYWAGLTTRQGATHQSDDLFRLKRVRVRGAHSADDLLQILSIKW
jgi:peptidoglycan/xylan/chitin deacetylase (PgdA/CDA1 family)